MELISNLALGFGVAWLPINLLCALAGCLLGIFFGLLPGLRAVAAMAAMAMLLPAVQALAPLPALTLLVGLYCGIRYGAAGADILVNRAAATPATLGDGYAMARQGRAGLALSSATLALFFGACAGTLVWVALVPVLGKLALQFGPAEFFALLLLGLTGAVVLGSGALLKGLAMAVLGLLLGLVGTDGHSGVVRFAFGVSELSDGIGLVVLAMGLFAYGEVISRLGRVLPVRELLAAPAQSLRPSLQDIKDIKGMGSALLRGTALGALLGLLPGDGVRLAALASQALEKKLPGKAGDIPLGKGNLRGLVAPQAALQAAAQTAFVPLMALGIAPNAVLALVLGAMTLHRVTPGPQLLGSNPQLFWGLIAAMWTVNLMLLLLNLSLARVWMRLLNLPYRWLFPAVLLICTIGAYSTRHSSLDVWLVAAFGVVGYVFDKLGMEPAPLLLGFVLGPLMEEQLRQALSQGDWSSFVTRPVSAGLLLAALVALVLLPALRSRLRKVAGQD